jgi:cysteinyl-tRNA synthetase
MARPFRLYNTLIRSVQDFKPLEAGKISLYVCGMTVYDDCHLGHARAMVVFDAFVRAQESRGWDVNFVRNFTDVDDKIIVRAAERGVEPIDLAQGFIDNFHRDMKDLGLSTPTAQPRVSESIDQIIALIGSLVDKGHAYASAGSVWFSVDSCAEYGKLSGQKVEHLQASSDPDSGKNSPLDFALWKAVKPGEPSWDSPWGPGRPGWHIECSAMARGNIGDSIDIHGGGLDLVFPHHENEVAQSECGTGHPFASIWMHNGMLVMDSGAKMGKSEGNAFQIHDLLKLYPAEAIRLFYLDTHYRSPLPWTGTLNDSLCKLARLYEAREVAQQMGGEEDPDTVAEALGADALTVLHLARGFKAGVESAIAEDFKTATAIGLVFEMARAINRMSNHKKAKKRGGTIAAEALEAFAELDRVLGLMQMTTEQFQDEVKAKRLPAMGLTTDDVDLLLAKRSEARTNKDWAAADSIRDELDDKGIVVMDAVHGSAWRVRI